MIVNRDFSLHQKLITGCSTTYEFLALRIRQTAYVRFKFNIENEYWDWKNSSKQFLWMKNVLNTNLGVEIMNSKRQVMGKLGQVVRVILSCARPLLLIIGSQFSFCLLKLRTELSHLTLYFTYNWLSASSLKKIDMTHCIFKEALIRTFLLQRGASTMFKRQLGVNGRV